MQTRADIDEKWAQYPCTVLEFCDTSFRFDLRKPLSQLERDALRELGRQRPFAILTAENPWGENVEDEPTEEQVRARAIENATRASELERQLIRDGTFFRRVDGVAPDGEYREHALAVSLERDEAVALARKLKQLALFWFDGNVFWLVPALADKPEERLPQ